MKIGAAVVSANAASTLLGGHRRLPLNGAALNHHTGVSCFAEYAVVSRRSSVRIKAGITHRDACGSPCTTPASSAMCSKPMRD